MKTICTVAVALATTAFATAGDELKSKATVGSVVERTFHHESELALDEMRMLIDGEEGPGPPGEMEQVVSTESSIVVQDKVLKVEGSSVSALERTFSVIQSSRSMSMNMMGQEKEAGTTEESPLEGKTVLFANDGESTLADWAEGNEGDGSLLDDLTMSLALEVLLPGDDVAEGDTWSIDPSLLATLARPGGNLHLQATEQTGGLIGPPEGFDAPQPEYDGTIQATFVGVREEEGRRFAEVELAIEAFAFIDLSDVEMGGPHEDAPSDMPMPEMESMNEEVEYGGEGLFLWDLESGRLRSLEIECDVRRTQTMTMRMDMGGGEQEIEQVMVMAGTESWDVSCDG